MEHNTTTLSSGTLSSSTIGLSSGTNYIHTSNPLAYSSGTTLYGSLTLNNNTNSMNQQVKVAVFQVTRNKYNEIKASEFIQEMWIEKKPGVSVDFAVARELGDEYEASEIVIKEIFTVTL